MMRSVQPGAAFAGRSHEGQAGEHGLCLAQPGQKFLTGPHNARDDNAIDVAVAKVPFGIERESQARRPDPLDRSQAFGKNIGYAIRVDQARHNFVLHFSAPCRSSPAARRRAASFGGAARSNPFAFRDKVNGPVRRGRLLRISHLTRGRT